MTRVKENYEKKSLAFSVVVPLYNEEENVSLLFKELIDALQGVVQLLKNPKTLKDATPKDDLFEKLRATITNKREKKPFSFGKKGKRFNIPSIKSILD